MTNQRHLVTSPDASLEAVRQMPPECIDQAAEMFARMPELRAAVRRLAVEQGDAGDGTLRPCLTAKQPQVTSGRRSANSAGVGHGTPELSDRRPSAVRELLG